MALEEYNLYIVREEDRGEILPNLFAAKLLSTDVEDEAVAFDSVTCYYAEKLNTAYPLQPVRVVALEFDNDGFEQMLNTNASTFFQWLKEVIYVTNPAYLFMDGGASSAYYAVGKIKSEQVFRQVGHLINAGQIEIIHPLMYFAPRLGDGLYAVVRQVPYYTIQNIPGAGCLLTLMKSENEQRKVEIMDPGIIYPKLLEHFKQTLSLMQERSS